jgi:pyruvate formate lyase activating enzyme
MTLTLPQTNALQTAGNSLPEGILFDIRKYSIHDGPGIRTAVFFKGCPLRCAWCHNPESQSFQPELILRPSRCIACEACVAACPNEAIEVFLHPRPLPQGGRGEIVTDRAKCQACGECTQVCYAEGRQLIGQTYSLEQVMAEIEGDRVFYEQSGGGVTFTGGEPMSQRAFLLALLRGCKARGLHTTLDTSGYCTWEALDEVGPFVDLFLYDLKLMDDTRHRQYTAVPNTLILENLRKLSEAGNTIRVRIPIIPGVNDDEENLRASGEFLAGLPNLQRVDILAYHSSAEAKYQNLGMGYTLPGLKSPTNEHMDEIAAILRGFGLTVSIGG